MPEQRLAPTLQHPVGRTLRAGASFITTFFVLPQLYKKNTDWQTMLSELRDTGVRTVTPKDAYNKSRRYMKAVQCRQVQLQ